MKRGFAHAFLVVGVVVILIIAAVAGFLLFQKYTSQAPVSAPTSVSQQASPSAQNVEIKTEYNNPFEEKTQYSNPFEENKNPMDYLNE